MEENISKRDQAHTMNYVAESHEIAADKQNTTKQSQTEGLKWIPWSCSSGIYWFKVSVKCNDDAIESRMKDDDGKPVIAISQATKEYGNIEHRILPWLQLHLVIL